MYNLPFKRSCFDKIMLSEVLEHLEDPQYALEECHRILKKRGRIILSTPYNERLSYQLCIHCNKPTPTHAHLHSFNLESLQSLLSNTGFKILTYSKNLNKVYNRLYISHFLRSLPFKMWKIVDNIFNYIIDKPTSIIVYAEKTD